MSSPQFDPTLGNRRSRTTGWTVGMLPAVAFVLGVVIWGNYAREQNTRANPPAVITTPAPAAGVPAPPPETTTGQRVPPPPPQR